MRRALIHQPNYLPGLSYFDKIARADVFVILDNVQYAKRNWTNRNRIKTPAGSHWLTVPVQSKGRYTQMVSETLVDGSRPWAYEHVTALQLNYGRASFFSTYAKELFEAIEQPCTELADLNCRLIELLCRQLGIETEAVSASSLGLSDDTVRAGASELLAGICELVRADTYLSGPGGRNYMDMEPFRRSRIEVVFHEYRHPVYDQLFGPFEPNLSVCDLLFNEGPRSVDILRSGSQLAVA